MKQFFFIFLGFFNVAIAQQPLFISTDKTTSLIFPFPVVHVDRGTTTIIVQPVKENDRILLVKAAVKKFSETNLHVVTSDGSVYTFTVGYSDQPSELSLQLVPQKKTSTATYCTSLLDNAGRRILKVEKGRVITRLIGIYIKDDVLYYQLEIHNHSPLDYDIDLLQFFIKDKRNAKRSSVQENLLTPLYIAGNTTKVKGYNFSVIVVALEKFTIPDAKFLGIQLVEKNGGRHFNLKVYNNQLMKALVLPELR